MNIDEAIRILTEHNKWRRAKEPYAGMPDDPRPPEPHEVGEAIDYAVEELHILKSLEK